MISLSISTQKPWHPNWLLYHGKDTEENSDNEFESKIFKDQDLFDDDEDLNEKRSRLPVILYGYERARNVKKPPMNKRDDEFSTSFYSRFSDEDKKLEKN